MSDKGFVEVLREVSRGKESEERVQFCYGNHEFFFVAGDAVDLAAIIEEEYIEKLLKEAERLFEEKMKRCPIFVDGMLCDLPF